MTHTQIASFSVVLFFALATLHQWLRRREQKASRLKRGLHSYISSARDAEATQDMIAIQ
jgi:hypothetical protein